MPVAPPDTSANQYVGRFAPSPTGELHQGSLLTAVASYLDARQAQGRWLVRMEDLDPPREQVGAADAILRSLEAHGLHWDQSVIYQSQRQAAYRERLLSLQQQQLCYPCNCNRQRLKTLSAYDGHCLLQPPVDGSANAVRVRVKNSEAITFEDLFQGQQSQHLANEVGDFVIRRKDQLFAYQLAVVADDIDQGITHVIRGIDLMDSTARQIYLFQLWQAPVPIYGHLPVIVNDQGQKLSKQTFAPPLRDSENSQNLWRTFVRLGLNPPHDLKAADCETQLRWGTEHWHRTRVPRTESINEGGGGRLPPWQQQ